MSATAMKSKSSRTDKRGAGKGIKSSGSWSAAGLRRIQPAGVGGHEDRSRQSPA